MGRCRDWLEKNAETLHAPKRGGGTLEALATIYKATPKRTKENVAKDNISRLRTICRLVFGRELAEVTCREVSPELWQNYQRQALAAAGRTFDLVTRYRENIAINAAVRAARCLFLPALLRAYRAAGLDPRPDAGEAVMLPEPYVPPSKVDDDSLVTQWAALESVDLRLWLVIGLARFSGMRREEIAAARVGWIEQRGGVCHIGLRDRPEENWWTKTGKPYTAQVIRPELAEYLAALVDFEDPDKLIVPDPSERDRAWWFERVPQEWLHAHGVTAAKPLHRLRGLYADEVARITSDAVTARLASIRAAQKALGHTTSTTTENHYLTEDAIR